jgi:hypothetical protein
MTEIEGAEPTWKVDPQQVQRLWPVIDVYGRVTRALAAQQARTRAVEEHAGNGSAA